MTDEDQWMTVGKPKKPKTGENGIAVAEEEENMKLIISLTMKTNGTKKDIIAPKKTQIPVKVKPENQQKAPKPKKKPEAPTAFKTLQAALHSLNIAELRNLLDATKIQFNNDVIMLKTAVGFLNEKLRLEKAEDVMLFDKPLDYPTSILPNELKSILKELVVNCNDESLKYFFHNLLQSLCEELNKSRNFVGNLLMLQQIAHYSPEACIGNLASTVILRNSYLNQPSICLSLFWALVSSGFCDTTIGIKVWVEIVSYGLTTKSYTKFAIDCLHKILSASEKTPTLAISLREYKTLIELLVSNQEKVKTKELQKTKWKCISMVTRKYVESLEEDDLEDFFKLMCIFCKRNPEIFAAEFVKLVNFYPVECVRLWRENFETLSRQNAFIFGYLDKNQDSEQLIEHQKFLDFIKSIDYKKNPNLSFVRDIPAKMTDNKKQKKAKKGSEGSGCSGCCKWVFGSFLLFGAIAGLIAYDTNVLHGGKFEESSVGRVLKQTGALPHVENAWFVSMKYSARGYKWAEEQAPIAYTKTRTFMQPYCEFFKDLGLTIFNAAVRGWESTKAYVAEKTPVVIAFTDKYVPGVGQKVVDFLDSACKGFCKLTCSSWSSTKEFFATKVFVGQLSPENLGKFYTSTQQKALGYYSWFYEKVDVYAKLK